MISKLKSIVKYFLRLPSQLYYKAAGSRLECNICGYLTNDFRSDVWFKSCICPAYDSYIRHRLLYEILNKKPGFDKETILRDKSVIHFAPEPSLRPHFKNLSANYRTADYFAEGYFYPGIDMHLDMVDMHVISDDSIDCMIAMDVLEHIPDDKKALSEIHRILKKGGFCILTVPQKDNLQTTEEDITLTNPAEREKRFGQSDHFRIYGTDFSEMLSKAGFSVSIFSKDDFDEATVKRYVMAPVEPSPHPLATNFQRIYFGKKM